MEFYITKCIKLIGANFAPTVYKTDPRDGQQYCLNYMGETFQWLSLFREGGATLPWSEDWAWQSNYTSNRQSVACDVDIDAFQKTLRRLIGLL